MDLTALLNTMHDLGVAQIDQLESKHSPQQVKEAVHRGWIARIGSTLSYELTKRGDRVRRGLPGEAERQLEFEVSLSDLVKLYVQTMPDKPTLDHFSIGHQGKVRIVIKG